jgi:RHS repeat-associated protein
MNKQRWFLAAILLLVTSFARAQTIEYIHTDALGSPVAVTNSSGAVIERTVYEPYGAVINRPLTNGPGYTGHVADAVTGLNYMQQRYYDPQLGRFLSNDPVTAAGAGTNFNRYWYGNDNPYVYTDPDGRCTGSIISNEDGTCKGSGGYTNDTRGDAQGMARARAAGDALSGHVVSIRSNVSSDAEMTDGHAWINDRSPDETDTSYGLWPDSHPAVEDNGPATDVRRNLEVQFGYNDQYVAQKSFPLTKAQYDEFIRFINKSDTWRYTHTCADWARDVIKAITGTRLDADDWFGFETPRELSKSMGR